MNNRFQKAVEQRGDRVAELDRKVIHWMARGREANIEVGRALNELKKILGHGKWQRHFKDTFGPSGLNLRTGERWMRLASQADADSKNVKLSILRPAADRGAQEIKEATERGQAEVIAAEGREPKKEVVRLDGFYQLRLRMSGDARDATDALRKLPDWPRAERRIVGLLRRLCVEFGVVKKDARRHP